MPIRISNKPPLRPLRLCVLCDASSSVRQKRIGCGLRAVSLRLHFIRLPKNKDWRKK